MSNQNIVLIDIREESECMEKYMVSSNQSVSIMNIPMRHIGFNKRWIEDKASNGLVYLVCRSGNRSDKVKSLYFKDNINIMSLEGGISNIKIFPGVAIIIDKGGWGRQQYIQFVFLAILLSFIWLLYNYYSRIDMMLIISAISVFILYQILSKSCYMERLVPLFNPAI